MFDTVVQVASVVIMLAVIVFLALVVITAGQAAWERLRGHSPHDEDAPDQ